MNQLQASIVQALDEAGDSYLGLQLQVDGRSLLDLVRQAETPMAAAEGAPDLAGAYGWMPIAMGALKDLSCTAQTDEKTVTVLDCACGWPGCWPLRARLQFLPRQVVWSHFEQGHRKGGAAGHWQYHHLGPFVFERAAYEQALGAAAAGP